MKSSSDKDIADWNSIAPTYIQSVGIPDDRIYQQFRHVLWDSLGEIGGMSILDVGCGHGWLSHQFVQAGASVLGIDGSHALLEQAATSYPNITFVQHDLTQGLPKLEKSYDRIVANIVLMDLPEIDGLLSEIRRTLSSRGRFIFTIPHPCFFNFKMHRDSETGQPFGRLLVITLKKFGAFKVLGGIITTIAVSHTTLSVYASMA